jgi:hypothetical protein
VSGEDAARRREQAPHPDCHERLDERANGRQVVRVVCRAERVTSARYLERRVVRLIDSAYPVRNVREIVEGIELRE